MKFLEVPFRSQRGTYEEKRTYRGFESLPIRHIFGLFAGRPKAEHPANTELIG